MTEECRENESEKTSMAKERIRILRVVERYDRPLPEGETHRQENDCLFHQIYSINI